MTQQQPTLFQPPAQTEVLGTWDRMVKRPNPVYMRRIGEAFAVDTSEGRMTGRPGDYIAHDPISGHFWPVSVAYVRAHYDVDPVTPTGLPDVA